MQDGSENTSDEEEYSNKYVAGNLLGHYDDDVRAIKKKYAAFMYRGDHSLLTASEEAHNKATRKRCRAEIGTYLDKVDAEEYAKQQQASGCTQSELRARAEFKRKHLAAMVVARTTERSAAKRCASLRSKLRSTPEREKHRKKHAAKKDGRNGRSLYGAVSVMQAKRRRPLTRPLGYVQRRHRTGYIHPLHRQGYLRPASLREGETDYDAEDSTSEDNYETGDELIYAEDGEVDWDAVHAMCRARDINENPELGRFGTLADSDSTDYDYGNPQDQDGSQGASQLSGDGDQEAEAEAAFTGEYIQMGTLQQIKYVLLTGFFCG